MLARVLLAASLLASLSVAQSPTIGVTGRIMKASVPSVCMQGETHRLACTDVYLKGDAAVLDALANQVVLITGKDVGVTCTVIAVETVAPPTMSLGFRGTLVPGGAAQFDACVNQPNPPHPFIVFAGLPGAFIPIDTTIGTLLLAPPLVPLCGGAGSPCGTCAKSIPPDPALVGVTAWTQAVGLGMHAELSNVACFLISSGSGPCADCCMGQPCWY